MEALSREKILIELMRSDCKLDAQRGLEMKDLRDLKDFDDTLRSAMLFGIFSPAGARRTSSVAILLVLHPGGKPGANPKSISHRCYLFGVAFVWQLTQETIVLPLGCLQGGPSSLQLSFRI